MADLDTRVRQEIEALHEFFVSWFNGALPDDDAVFEREFLQRFDDRFVLIPPAGKLLALDVLAQSIRAGYGKNPAFEIEIHDVNVRRRAAGQVLATYEEWQRNALASTPPDNGRIATVLFADDGASLRWLHVHETWMPEERMRAGPGAPR